VTWILALLSYLKDFVIRLWNLVLKQVQDLLSPTKSQEPQPPSSSEPESEQ